jgi:hypothetical protein
MRRSTTLSVRKAWMIQKQLPRQRLESMLTPNSIALLSAALRHLPLLPCPDILCLIAYTCINQCILCLGALSKCNLPIAHTFNLQILNKVRFVDSKVYIYVNRHAWKSQLNTVFHAGLEEFHAVAMGDTYHTSSRSSLGYVDDETVGHRMWVIEREWALKTMQNAIADIGEENGLDMTSLGIDCKWLRPACCEELILSQRFWLTGSSC